MFSATSQRQGSQNPSPQRLPAQEAPTQKGGAMGALMIDDDDDAQPENSNTAGGEAVGYNANEFRHLNVSDEVSL